ncbi:MAG: MoaD/ThiS family protein [Dehalococcoidia bacterium]|nr:MoaD/ThiS family protein [Dehalococcoidia bacterium]
MSVTVWISGSLRQATEGKTEAEVVAKDIAGCLDELEIQFPGLKERLYDDQGELYPFVDIFVNGDSLRSLQGLATQLKEGDKVSILPVFAGG